MAEELHFGRAAERLHMTQPPLSHQIKQLERELGVKLLQRTTRHVKITNAGEVFLERSRHILREVADAKEAVLTADRGQAGNIRIGVTGTTMWPLITRMSRSYRERFPLVRLDLQPANFSEQQVSALLSGTVDIAFLRAPVPDSPLTGRILLQEPLMIAMSEQHPMARLESIKLAAMELEDFVSYSAMHAASLRHAAARACWYAGFIPRIIQDATSTPTILSLVGADVGVALLPASAESLQFAGVVYRPITDVDQRVPISLAWRINDHSPVLAEFLAVAEEVAPRRAEE